MQNPTRLYDNFQPTRYNLDINLNREARTFSGIVEITGNQTSRSNHLQLHSKDLNIRSAKIDSIPVRDIKNDQSEANDVIILDTGITAGIHTVTIEFDGKITDSMHGLYPCYYEHGGVKKELLATQFESHHAREVFPCIDEPSAKAVFELTLTTEENLQVLSNMPVKSQSAQSGLMRTSFEETPKMSTYLLAFVVGELHRKTALTKSGVEVNVWAVPSQSNDLFDFPLQTAVRCIDFFDEYFQVPYPLPKVDHIALPDFSSGAMENWGLITYREVALLADKNTAQSSREWIATVIAHETSHQWFGNLVTMKWWDDLWLNESFATLMEYIAVDSLFPEWNAWNNFASQETLSALRRDQLAGVQAVHTTVNHPDEITTLFDSSIVYAKGARLLKMLNSYVGDESFRVGLNSYFKEHAYGNTTGDDLWKALGDASGKDTDSFMSAWITQSGFPIVSFKSTSKGYELHQERFIIGGLPDERLWPIPLSAVDPSLPEVLDTQTVALEKMPECPLLNHGNTSHFITEYTEAELNKIYALLDAGKVDTIDRLALLHETSMIAHTPRTSTAVLINMLSHYSNENQEPVWSIMGMVIGDLKRFVEDSAPDEANLKKYTTTLCLPMLNTLGFKQLDNESEQETKLRATILGLLTYAEYQPVIDYGLSTFVQTDNPEKLDSNTRSIIFSINAKYGSQADFEKLIHLYDTTINPELKDDLVSGLTAVRSTQQIELLLSRITNSKLIKPQDVMRWFISLLRNRYARNLTWSWMTDNWAWIEQTFAGDKGYDDFARYSASIFGNRDWLQKYNEFFEAKSSQLALHRAVEIGKTEIAGRIEWLEADAEAVIAELARETS